MAARAPEYSVAATVRPAVRARAQRDIAVILGPGERLDLLTVCLALATSLHVAMLIVAFVGGLLKDLHAAVSDNRDRLHEFFWRQYDVEVDKPKDPPKEKEEEPPPPPPPEPEPAAAPKAVAPPPKEEDPYKDAKPLPAEATKVITAAPKNDDPVELPTIVSGNGNAVGGMQSEAGKGDQIVKNRAAGLDGLQGGRGTASAPPPPPPPPAEDRSRPPTIVGSTSWNCPFPPEADADQIDSAVVGVNITVRPDGSILSVSVVNDPGHGFGRAARMCALAKRGVPALNRAGEPIVGSFLANVRFSR